MSLPSAHDRRLDCERIARAAAELLRSRFGDPGEISDKGDPSRWYDVVTEVDVLSEQLVVGMIAELNPDALILAEEGGFTTSGGDRVTVDAHEVEELWIVDPLDGTINFAHHIPHFAVSIACWRRGVPFAGAIADPMVGEVFSFEQPADGEDGEAGAFHDGRAVTLVDPGGAANSLIYVGSSAARIPDLIGRFRGVRQLASAALALAWAGVGRCGVYVQFGNLNAWDWAAGVPFILAAGGSVSDGAGATWTGPLDDTTGIIAGATTAQGEVVATLTATATVSS